MKLYGVKKLADLSGVSVRTLHHYDKIGLLSPANRTDTGYRTYGESELLRLQQILFYKELDFSLREISDLLDDPDFDLVTALENHRSTLKQKRSRLFTLLKTIDQTINHLKKGIIMKDPAMLYEGLPKEVGTSFRTEAIKKYGEEAITTAEQKLIARGKEGFQQLQAAAEELYDKLFAIRQLEPSGDNVQELIANHYLITRKFWGTEHVKDKQAAAYAGLGQLYVDDARFMMREGTAQPEFSKFLRDAMRYFANTHLSG